MKGWLKNMLYSSNPEVRKKAKEIAERQARWKREDMERLYQSPAYTGKKPAKTARQM